ncbi:amino acid ABC transporter, periplasmic cysteine-binding protein [Campylobacter volucris]|uniref:Amino acid ABC transporter, periplasmic cysteine-binding protein n=1 Tax=Campylobacter volucris TaxID=1031542 RepID=A0AAE6D054_9BACT|nr:amino acid ABC transporter, periplasmic cysteine-binding protein [Campylobacter volucris]AJC93998.1 amino acid ABC transporter, periplasmic cysteine-binding protein [Campylobacter volucris LMG 24379]KAB0580158.1 amino acid ABC transporter, periplasmic cysteine-binding protein [Campylobacter volucris]QBL13627.1 amino acid ABC transporter, periplasmic cysteine-binding protein [Campylobacter volucris]QEL08212.1 amino acid ABC transporter, periplasmic cysteine-binding protein [Campylobacter volu
MKKILFISFLMALFFSACSNDKASENSIERIKQQGVVRIGVFGDKPPFGYLDAQGVNQGYDVYFAKRIAKELLGDENKVQFVLVEAANRVEFLQSNKVDIILANFTKTPERAEVVDFALPYMKVALGVVAPKDSTIKSVEDLKDKTLILNKGTTADAYFTKNMPEIKTIKFDQNTETFAALLGKRGDALSHDNALLFAWAKENPDFEVAIKELGNHDVIAPAVKKGDKEMLNFLNELIVKLGKEQFFHKAYDETLKPFFSDDIKADDVVIEEGKI